MSSVDAALNTLPASGDLEAMNAMALPIGVGLADEREESDDSLIARAARGEALAIGALYRRYHQPVRDFARRLVGDLASAEDLVQEVFVALPRAARHYRGEASLGTFLVSIAINRSRTHLRGAMRRRATLDRFEQEPQRPSQGPDDTVERRELALKLTRALDELPLDQRVAFVLCEVEERTAAEVAVMLEVPEGTVRSRLFHARGKLRQHFDAEDA